MDAWTPQAVLKLILGLWQAGLGLAAILTFCWVWYAACRYGWPWSRKKPSAD